MKVVDQKPTLRTWWGEQEQRAYRCVLAFIGLDCIVVGIVTWTGISVMLGVGMLAFAVRYWTADRPTS